jgi:hypothetical protein
MIKLEEREILEVAINKEESPDIKKSVISLVCENTPYFKKNLLKYGCRKCESLTRNERVHMYA